ncbi:helicase, partial [Klebsiella pneumoniae]
RQNKAVIETVDGVQRIRGLAGSGKTIVLALKAAYLHTQYPDWRIAVTFHTRSLKGQFRRLINNFCIEQSGEEPDWTKIRIINAWGAPGGDARDG